MKKISGFILAIMIMAVVIPSCKKYEEGPMLSLRSKKARIVNEWKVEKAYENAVDVTAAFQAFQPNLVMNIKDNGDVVYSYTDQAGQSNSFTSTWEFTSDKTGIIITTGTVAVTHDILRLKNDELWLKKTYTDSGLTTIEEVHYITK